ncbi:hypothetical protein C0Q70_17769 [Pomacea canaliculata]|uniref:Uncharacterized protein n=1 Tax=Pomacea canaliculata TaxID=400727 RepID=A0A2T7NLD2_POMCA|nr:hypothetical protein C0Q70_17769 [Pomacea canaliculata]
MLCVSLNLRNRREVGRRNRRRHRMPWALHSSRCALCLILVLSRQSRQRHGVTPLLVHFDVIGSDVFLGLT